ncbi:MAG: HAMP domain-containing protein [Candidatus Riflebacteria bacterium]|nr:HAMP domain-containing protein [Candidatus Riflebacteria bacterium]
MASQDEKSGKIAWYRRIGNRIVLTAIVAAVLPLFLLGGTVAVKVRLDLVQQTLTSQKNTMMSLLHGFGSLFQNYRRQIESMVALPDIQSMRHERQIKIVHDFLDQQKIYFGCNIYDREGRKILSAVRNDQDFGKTPATGTIDFAGDPAYGQSFRNVVKTRQAALFANDATELSEKKLFLMVPISDFVNPEEVVGVISCSISISSPDIHEIVCGFPIAESDILILLDRHGNILSSQGHLPEGLRAINVEKVSRKKIENILLDLVGTTYLGTIAALPGSEGLLLVARPRHLVLAFLNQLLLDLALMLVVAFVIAVAAGFFMSRSLAEGISILVDAIRNVASGAVSHRVDLRGEDELAEAAQAFNDMLNTLEKHRMMDDIWHQEWESAQKKAEGDSSPEASSR